MRGGTAKKPPWLGIEMEDTEIISTVAENVRKARKAAGLSQEELALEADVDRTYISQVERGKRNITVVILARLARAMRTSAAELLADTRRIVEGARSRDDYRGLLNALCHAWTIPFMYVSYVRWWCNEWDFLKSLL
jgi:transcriptional regulator with XRE-family HTH domain